MENFHFSQGEDLSISFSKHLSSNEKRLIQEIEHDKFQSTLQIESFQKRYGFSSNDEIELFLKKFSEKYLIIVNHKKESKHFIPILSSFYFEKKQIHLFFSNYVLNSFEAGTLLNRIGIHRMLVFSEKYSYKLFHLVNTSKLPYFSLNIDDFKKMFHLHDKYKRFYDMEKNILLPIINDINANSHFFISYHKIKKSDYHSSKITALEFSIRRKVENSETKIIDTIMNRIKNKISNFSEIHALLLEILSLHGKEYLEKKIQEALKNPSANFEEQIKNLLTKKEKQFIPIKIVQKKANSLFDLHLEVLSVLKQYKNFHKINNLELLLKLYHMKDKEELILKYEEIFLRITYNKDSESMIELLKQSA